eukprot:3071776-Amphidinium_carterae.1
MPSLMPVLIANNTQDGQCASPKRPKTKSRLRDGRTNCYVNASCEGTQISGSPTASVRRFHS